MINRTLVENVRDEATLLALLGAPEVSGGLGWPVAPEFAFEEVPEIAQGVKGDGKVRVSRLIPAGVAHERLVILAEFERPYLRRDLRELLRSLRAYARQTAKFPDHTGLGDTIFIVAAPGYEDLRFVLFEERQGGQPKLRSFGWNKGSLGRTLLTHNLPKLDWDNRLNWIDAWSVEALTKEFFREISERFYYTVDAVRSKFPSEDSARLSVQTLFNRLLFLRFVEEKGWLSYNGDTRYLQALWNAGKSDKNPLWPTRLSALFDALNHPTSDQVHVIAKPLIGDVHYLNGGLFEQTIDPALPFPASVFDKLLGEDGLFYRYNFTVEESTPLDVEIAIDPEMLGKIFEQLTISTKRHDTGSYYTPREIVQFMCREALVGYLGSKGLPELKARKLVYEHDDSELTNQEGTLAFNALKEIKVVDPACGSGAYLLGMLQELYALFEKLRRDDRKFSADPAKEAHDRKLWIIENNIYGVDLQAFATNTAMLRLWLTLLVEDTGASPQPLPNLEYKIETGDALLGPDPSQPIDWSNTKKGAQAGLDLESVHDTVDALRKLREKYQNAHGSEKQTFKGELETKLAELREKVTGTREKNPAKFDWRVEFFDVFLEDPSKRQPGFDVALANPPYVRMELIKAIKPNLRLSFPDIYSERTDLYCFFYARAIDLLRDCGQISFISSSSWLRAKYGKNLRVYVCNNCKILSITDFGELPIFEDVATFPMIFIAAKDRRGHAGMMHFTKVPSLAHPYPDVLAVTALHGGGAMPRADESGDWHFADSVGADNLQAMSRNGSRLAEIINEQFLYGVKTGLNEALVDPSGRVVLKGELPRSGSRKKGVFFVGDTELNGMRARDARSTDHVRPLLVGDDCRRWTPRKSRRSLIYTYHGIDPNSIPAILDYLRPFRARLEQRATTQNWYELQQPQERYAKLFPSPKIVYPVICKEPRFGLDYDGHFINDKAYAIPIADFYLLAVLNSACAWNWITTKCPRLLGGSYELRSTIIGDLPIPRASDSDQDAIAALVQKCLDAKTADPNAEVSELEAEIDARVEFLYFHRGEHGTCEVTHEDGTTETIPIPDTYDEWLALKKAEEGTVIEEVRKLLAIGHETNTFECKSSFAWDVKKDEQGDYLKDQVHIAICAMLNSNGGDLLVGVDDDMNIVGLQKDLSRYHDLDTLISAIEGSLGTTLKPNPIGLVAIESVQIDGKVILRIRVKPNHEERYEFKDKIYVRRNAKSKPELTAAEAAAWWSKRKAGEI